MNRFKRFGLVNRVPEELWTDAPNSALEVGNKTTLKKKKCKKAKWLSEEAFQVTEERRSEKQGRGGKDHPSECRVPENSKERQEGLLP